MYICKRVLWFRWPNLTSANDSSLWHINWLFKKGWVEGQGKIPDLPLNIIDWLFVMPFLW